jgi:dolichol-phosphate mannosyltransferase
VKISLITPTYNERKNLAALVERIFDACAGLDLELIVVDDNSPDGTGQLADELAADYPISVIHRQERGLSGAVVAGFGAAQGEVIGVIDADLSHPPEKIPELIAPLLDGQADLVVASRLIKGGGVERWPWPRKLLSRLATLLAWPLVPVRDPMSGFFFLRREVLDGVPIVPRGYKIGLEILVKGRYTRVVELPYLFLGRFVGASKMDTKVHWDYLVQLVHLYAYRLSHGRRR